MCGRPATPRMRNYIRRSDSLCYILLVLRICGWLLLVSTPAVCESVFVSVNNIPAQATRVAVVIDGGAISGQLTGQQDFAYGTSSANLTVGVPAGGPYRMRAVAYDGTVGGSPLLRSGQAISIQVSTGGLLSVTIGLGDISITRDPSTPALGATGSRVTFSFDITDPGDAIEGLSGLFYSSPTLFVSPNPGPAVVNPVTKVISGSYVAAFTEYLPLTGTALYYFMQVMVRWAPGSPVLNSPSAGLPAFLLTLTTGTTISITIQNI